MEVEKKGEMRGIRNEWGENEGLGGLNGQIVKKGPAGSGRV